MMNWVRSKLSARAPVVGADAALTQPPDLNKKSGDEHVSAGRFADAERCYRNVSELDAGYPRALMMLGFVLKEQGRDEEARSHIERSLSLAPDDAEAHYILASILEATGPRDTQIVHLQKAISLRPDFVAARRQLIASLFALNQRAEAAQLCEEGLAISPNSVELHISRLNLHVHAGENAFAVASCIRTLALDPSLTSIQQYLSRLLLDSGQLEQAEASYRREIVLTPGHFGPHHMLGVVLNRLKRNAEAIASFEHAISLDPQSAASYSSLAAAYTDLDDTSEANLSIAQANFEKAVALDPRNPDILYGLGFSYWRSARIESALASFDKAIEADAGHAKARWARVMLWAPAFSKKNADDSHDRSGFAAELADFEHWWRSSEIAGDTFVGELQPFFLTYQEENNLALLKQYGQVCALAMQRWLDREKSPPFRRPMQKRIRLGIVSADIRFHSNWIALIKGWFLSFDIERFELIVFSLTDRHDAESALARAKADVFVSGLANLSQWVSAMREQNCEVLLYPAVGLNPLTLQLASLRLAPIQINTWGHADTSGLPTLDYYVSAACFEPISARDHYSEQLILLPNLGNSVQPMNIAPGPPTFATALNIDLQRPLLICPGTPFKYQPEHDHIFAEIARCVPNAQLIFFLPAGQALGNVLRARITKEFEVAGLNVHDHVRFVRWLTIPEFHSLLRHANVMLDTIGFSGFNTAVQAMECGLPLVTREGRFLRGRLASGVLRRMDLNELIVQSKSEYVDLVIKLATDRGYLMHIRQEIERRRSVLFDDRTALSQFQTFLETVARPTRVET